jgi:tRNA dimethylallyltransferase
MLDLVDPSDDFSVPQYVAAAHAVARQVQARGRTVLFVGGTPLYLKALLRGVYPGPPADWDFRRQIDEELQQVPLAALHQRLQQVDPLTASRLHPHDKRRIVRALEVYRATGQPISHEQLQFDEVPRQPARVFVLQWSRAELHRRIESRVQGMFAAGLVAEVNGLVQRFGQLGRTAAQAVGYREVLSYVAGQQTLEQTVQQVQQRTRQFARRQQTWFRSLPECRPIRMDDGFDPAEVAARVLARS